MTFFLQTNPRSWQSFHLSDKAFLSVASSNKKFTTPTEVVPPNPTFL